MEYSHESVLKDEALEWLNLDQGKVIVDGTLGLGGHTAAILEQIGKEGKVIGFDQDERHLGWARERLKEYGDRVVFVHSNFAHLKQELENHNVESVDGVLLDLGLASPHVDDGERGFSFKKEGPLDMRFDRNTSLTAEEIVNSWPGEMIVEIIKKYGELKGVYKIVRAIEHARKEARLTTTTQLAEVICGAVYKKDHNNALTLVFQALRIAVNEELQVLEEVLKQAVDVLKPGGRVVVISYHSLEDRIVKHFFKGQTRDCICPREIPMCVCDTTPTLKILTKKPVLPSEEEVERNPRSRSAKMRVAEKL